MFPAWQSTKPSHRSTVLWSLLSVSLIVGLVLGHAAFRSLSDDLARQRTLFETIDPGSASADGVLAVEPWIARCGRSCAIGYLDFAARHGNEATAVSRREVKKQLARAAAAPAAQRLELDHRDLERRIRRALAVDMLLDGIDDRLLMVAVLGEKTNPGILERRLLFGDPEIGSFEALLLLPPGIGPHPAVIGLHGHRERAEDFASEHSGRNLARNGFAVLIPTLRVHNCKPSETRIALELLENGLTLMGLRVYETLLMAKYLDSLDQVDSSRIGLFGHSGGSSIANLLVRVSDAFSAKVTDLPSTYLDRCGLLGVHCETIPALAPLTAEIAFEADLAIPTLEVPYGFEDPAIQARIISFFEAALVAGEPQQPSP
jgi:dienelactone hydrolase